MTNLEREMRACFDFFYNECSLSENGYGLIRDRWPGHPDMASIAGVGFGLAAYCIGAEYGYVSFSAAEEDHVRFRQILENVVHYAEYWKGELESMNRGASVQDEADDPRLTMLRV